jgi:hypothetical protein
MLGRFIELAVPSREPLASAEFYGKLGFSIAPDTGSVPSAHATFSDGRISLGLYEPSLEEPTLVFVRPDLARALEQFEEAGLIVDTAAIGDHAFNQIDGRIRSGLRVRIIEARTSSPVPPKPSLLGWFEEISFPMVQPDTDGLESFGFVLFETSSAVGRRVTLTNDAVTIGLHGVHLLPRAWLTFENDDIDQLRHSLASRGISENRSMMPGFDRSHGLILVSPDGLPILVRASDNAREAR